MQGMTVSEVAEQADTTADTVRYYERIELIPEADRSDSGYRLYGSEDVDRLRFIKRAQRFGLRLEDIKELVGIRDRGLCPCGHARELLADRLSELDEQITQLRRLRADVSALLEADDTGPGMWPCGTEDPGLDPTLS